MSMVKSYRRMCSVLILFAATVILLTHIYLEQTVPCDETDYTLTSKKAADPEHDKKDEDDFRLLVQKTLNHHQHNEHNKHNEHNENQNQQQQHDLEGFRENATFVTLARNSDLGDLMQTIRSVEDRYNHRYKHDWVFLNEERFSDEFVNLTTKLISGQTRYGRIPKEHWSYPDWINQTIAAEARQDMREQNIIYGDSESYRHMCRFESGFFFQHPIMQEYRYYWRVEPSTLLHCDIDYNVFEYMRVNNKKYAFTIALLEFGKTVESLWDVTKNFLSHHSHYVARNSLIQFVSDDNGENYNLCHFWSNFEVADMDFWRGEAYQKYFNYLDSSGGFFYERWGDAPVHSIAAALFLDRSEITFLDTIGYTHPPFTHCPEDCDERNLTCSCLPGNNFDWSGYSCLPQYYNAQKMAHMIPEIV